MPVTDKASLIKRALNGMVCVYKPPGCTVDQLRAKLLTRLCDELNESKVRPPAPMVEISGDTNLPMKVNVVENLADHPLVVGPRYLVRDFRSNFGTHLGKNTSGVFLFGLDNGTSLARKFRESRPVRAYRVYGQFGLATDTYFHTGKVVEKAQHKHVTRAKVDKVVAHMQAMHQKKMYEMCGLDMASQAAYELASRGLLRPATSKYPIVYGVKCIHYERPDFIIEIQSINEYEKYLHGFIHDIGMQLRTVAYCTKVIRIREGVFTLEHTLLKKHWSLQHVIDNIQTCQKLWKLHGGPDVQTPELKLLPEKEEIQKYLMDDNSDQQLMIQSH